MYSYITEELPRTVFENFKEIDAERVSIFGHSMGGHGALSLVSMGPSLLPRLQFVRGRSVKSEWLTTDGSCMG